MRLRDYYIDKVPSDAYLRDDTVQVYLDIGGYSFISFDAPNNDFQWNLYRRVMDWCIENLDGWDFMRVGHRVYFDTDEIAVLVRMSTSD